MGRKQHQKSNWKSSIFSLFFFFSLLEPKFTFRWLWFSWMWAEQTQQGAAVGSTTTLPWCFMHPRGRVVHEGHGWAPRLWGNRWWVLETTESGVMLTVSRGYGADAAACLSVNWRRSGSEQRPAGLSPTLSLECVCMRLTAIWLFTRAFKMTCLHLSKSEQSFYILKALPCSWKIITQKLSNLYTNTSFSDLLHNIGVSLCVQSLCTVRKRAITQGNWCILWFMALCVQMRTHWYIQVADNETQLLHIHEDIITFPLLGYFMVFWSDLSRLVMNVCETVQTSSSPLSSEVTRVPQKPGTASSVL